MENIKPLHAQTFICASRNGEFNQFLNYMYYDPDKYYADLIHKPSEYENEILKLWDNMQGFLDEETIKINGTTVTPKVKYVSIEHIGSDTLPIISWIITYNGELKSSENIYETWSDEEIAEYDFESYWCFPPNAKLLEIDTLLEFEVQGNILLAWARKGDKVGGYEKIVFSLSM
ncbi:MAG: hypothetical protein ACTSSJ_02315 [Candidatus Odinarchaeia archaeon]